MTALEIILLLIGIICVAASFIFFIKADGPETAVSAVELSDKQKEDIKKQIAQAYEEQMEEMTDVVHERTETALEKLSNQKIQEFSDYSETVLGELNKNHTEVMFLYDMLNEKNKEVHNNIRDISLAADQLNSAKEAAKAVVAETAEVVTDIKQATALAVEAAAAVKVQPEPAAKPFMQPEAEQKEEAAIHFENPAESTSYLTENAQPEPVFEESGEIVSVQEPQSEPEPAAKPPAKKTTRKRSPKASAASSPEMSEQPRTPRGSAAAERPKTRTRTKPSAGGAQLVSGGNKKEAILALYREGASNVDIAKTLGLGIGEVRLVIDLFKGRQE